MRPPSGLRAASPVIRTSARAEAGHRSSERFVFLFMTMIISHCNGNSLE
jgi:hypothetical protein